jgi:hypothetical protein
MFNAFLLSYMRKGRKLLTSLTEDVVLEISKTEFNAYCGSVEYFTTNVAIVSSPPKMSANPRLDANAAGVVGTIDSLTGVKCDKAHYPNLKNDKYFSTWNQGFIATAHMQHTQHVLDET